MVVASGLFATFLSDIVSVFGFIGAFCGIFISVYFPFVIKIHLSEKKWYQGWNLVISVVGGMLCIAAFAAVIISGVKIVDPNFKFS